MSPEAMTVGPDANRTMDERWMLASVMDGLPALVYFKDLAGRYVRVSQTYLDVTGIDDVAGVLGLTDLESGMPAAQAERLRDEEAQLISGEVDTVDHEEYVQGRVRNGWYKTIKQVVRDDAGEIVGTYGVSLDITARKLAEEEVWAASERLTAANEHLTSTMHDLAEAQNELLQARKLEAIGQLAAGVAHEINTPIQFIGDNSGFALDGVRSLLDALTAADALAAAADAGEGHAVATAARAYREAASRADVEFLRGELPVAIEQTIEGTVRVTEIVRALKDFAHPANDVLTLVDINRIIATTLTVSKNEWKYAADVHFDPDPDLPLVAGLPGPLQQVLLIIIVNAAQAISATESRHGRIDVSTAYDEEWVTILIADDGPGIPAEVRDRIFEPFFTTKPVGQGSGQGLSVARSIIVKRHDGHLTFASAPGRGTTFVIRLPRHDDHPASAAYDDDVIG